MLENGLVEINDQEWVGLDFGEGWILIFHICATMIRDAAWHCGRANEDVAGLRKKVSFVTDWTHALFPTRCLSCGNHHCLCAQFKETLKSEKEKGNT